jgi:hypothetical protein
LLLLLLLLFTQMLTLSTKNCLPYFFLLSERSAADTPEKKAPHLAP